MHLVTFERTGEKAVSVTARSALQEALGRLEGLENAPAAGRRLGALVQRGPFAGRVVDLNRALAFKLAFDDAGAPEAVADSMLPSDALAFLRRLDEGLGAAHAALHFVDGLHPRYDMPDLGDVGILEPRTALRLHAPVPRPGKILAVAQNYPAHAAELGPAAVPEEPVLFLKAPSAVIGPDDEIVLPRASHAVDYEGELAVVIGRSAREVEAERALHYVAGYCAANDVSARDFQNQRGQRFIGKSCDTFAPLGPALVTADEIADPQDLALRTLVSGEPMQAAHTKEMTFSVAEIIAFASRLMTLEPGDVILTGTPAGVGVARKPPRFLREGDVVEVQVERVGALRSFVRGPRSS